MASRKPTEFADPALEARRREILAELESLHGTRAIGAEEYRQRAEVARRAEDEAELAAVRPSSTERGPARLAPTPPARPSPTPPARPSPTPPAAPATPARSASPARHPALQRPSEVDAGEETGFVLAVMGSSARTGPWEPPETLYAFALLGGIDLDFRQAALLEGVTEVQCLALMGGMKIIVPDDVDVEVSGIGFMGGFDHVSHHGPGEDRPLIRIKGLALMGGVTVQVKPPVQERAAKRIARKIREWV